MTTQKQYNVLRQSMRRLHIKVDLLNENEVVVDSLEGIATDGSISIDNNSSHRRSGNLTMVLDKRYNLLPSPSSKIWFNKRCAISVSIDNFTGERIPFKLGKFAIDDVQLNFSKSDKTISLQLKDYMAFLDGTLGGELAHQIDIPSKGVSIREAIIAILTDLGKLSIEDISVDGISELLPYDIEKSSGTPVYEIVKELIDPYECYDFYYNVDGYLILEQIRDKQGDPIIERFSGDETDFTVSSGSGIDFKNVKNSIWVWGAVMEDGKQPMWVYTNRFARDSHSDMLAISDKVFGDICYVRNLDKSYVWNETSWELLVFNVIEMFNVENIGEKVKTVNETTIQDTKVARLNAEFTLKKHSSFAETVNISCIPLYNLDVNKKIYVEVKDGFKGDYLIDSLTIPLDISSEMSITGTKMYY